jgi:tRNA 2-thiouridine synthesizing protein A
MKPIESPLEDAESAARLVQELDRWSRAACLDCEQSLCGHQVLASIFMGAKDAPLCLHCLAARMDERQTEFRDRLISFLLRRPCFEQAWQVANQREGFGATNAPPCLEFEANSLPAAQPPPSNAAHAEYNGEVGETWDAGDLGCGELVLQLRIRLQNKPAGSVMRVVARDPGAPEDLPAWCRMTRNELLAANHPEYIIKRKEG